MSQLHPQHLGHYLSYPQGKPRWHCECSCICSINLTVIYLNCIIVWWKCFFVLDWKKTFYYLTELWKQAVYYGKYSCFIHLSWSFFGFPLYLYLFFLSFKLENGNRKNLSYVIWNLLTDIWQKCVAHLLLMFSYLLLSWFTVFIRHSQYTQLFLHEITEKNIYISNISSISSGSSSLSIRASSQNLCGCLREEKEVNMGSSSSSYAPKTIYLDVDGKVQKVGLILVKRLYFWVFCLLTL